jgi:GMP synthase-like glutamine amidotransferase
MIVYVDLENDHLRQDSKLWQYFATKILETKYRLEEVSGESCLIVHYGRLTPALLHGLNPQAIIVSGHYSHPKHYAEVDLAGLRAIFKEPKWPTLGVCGAFQLMAQTYGASFGPIKPLSLEASDVTPDTPLPPNLSDPSLNLTVQNEAAEQGFMPVRVLHGHPLFQALGSTPVFFQLHSCEVKSLPEPFQLLADSELCQLQVMAHADTPLFGTQFHPELYDEAHPDGRQLLKNFFRIAGIIQ